MNPILTSLSPPTLYDSSRWKGLKVGLLGGSFNPPHKGHYHIATLAMRRLHLDYIWWLVTPQSPLKSAQGLLPFKKRYELVETLTRHNPRFMVSDLEEKLQSRYTYETTEKLQKRFSSTQFVWICGMDNAHIFHKWDRWKSLAASLPIIFIARPPSLGLIKNCPIRMLGPQKRHRFIDNTDPLNTRQNHIHWLLDTKMIDMSSSYLRSLKNQ